MTAKSLIFCTIVLALLLSVVKVFFVSLFDVTPWYMTTLYILVTAVVTTGVVRRAGVLNHFEVIVSSIFWIPLILLWDFAILTAIIGYDVFRELFWWLGYAAMVCALVLFHKWAPLDKD